MSERPSPRAIISHKMNGVRPWDQAQVVLDNLAAHGYVITHPDDPPTPDDGHRWAGDVYDLQFTGCVHCGAPVASHKANQL